MTFTTIAPYSARHNPSVDPEDQLTDAVRRANYLAGKFEEAINKQSEIQAAPEALLVTAHLLAQAVLAIRALVERRLDGGPLPEVTKERFRKTWDAAKAAEAKAKSLARDKEWRIWVALRPIGDRAFWQLKRQQTGAVSKMTSQAAEHLADERLNDAGMKLTYAAAMAAVITGDLGYKAITEPMVTLANKLYSG